MLKALKALLDTAPPPGAPAAVAVDPVLAAAVLLVRTATADGHIDDSERRTLAARLATWLDADATAVAALIAEAESAPAGIDDLSRFARSLSNRLPPGERAKVLDVLWDVAYADGRLDAKEADTVRTIGRILGFGDDDMAFAGRRARARADGW